MKKLIILTIAAMMSAISFAQTSADIVMRTHTADGSMTPLLTKNIKDICFEEITPLTMDITVSNIKQDAMDIDFPMPEGCKFWLMCFTKEQITGTDKEVRMAIKAKFNDEFKESKFLRIPKLDPGTTYYIYALMFDNDGVPAGIAKASATTLPATKDQFTIEVKDVTKTSATVTFTPKDNAMTYYYFVVSNATRQQMIDKYENIQNADLEFLKYNAQRGGYDLNFYLGQILAKGPVTKDARDIAQGNLTPGTVYYAYCYGMNSDGSFTTDVYEQKFSTEAVTPSKNVITCEVVKTYSNGCDVKTTTTNGDPYIIDAQPKATWEKALSQHQGNAVETANELLRIAYSGYADNYTVTGNYEGKKDAGSPDTEYVLIVCGFDSAVTTDVQIIPFKTLAQ